MQESQVHGRLVAVLMVLCLGSCHQNSYAQHNVTFDVIRSEGDGIIRFAQALQDCNAGFQALSKKPRATPGEIAELERKANAVRVGISEYRRDLIGFISKLKAANIWTSEFDSHFVEMAAKSGYAPALIADIKGFGGARSTLEKELAQTGSLSAGVELNLKELKTLGSRSPANSIREAHAVASTNACGAYLAAMIACTCMCSSPPCPCTWLK